MAPDTTLDQLALLANKVVEVAGPCVSSIINTSQSDFNEELQQLHSEVSILKALLKGLLNPHITREVTDGTPPVAAHLALVIPLLRLLCVHTTNASVMRNVSTHQLAPGPPLQFQVCSPPTLTTLSILYL